MVSELTSDKLTKDLKVRRFTLDDGASVHVRMPDRSVSVEITRAGDAYRIALVTSEPANEELRARVQDWYDGFLQRNNSDGALDIGTLKKAFDGICQQYRTRHMPPKPVDIEKLMPAPDFEVGEEDVKEPCRTYPYKIVREVLAGERSRKDLRWGYLEHHSDQCIRVEMPDPSTNLIIQRQSTNEGTQHWVFLSPGEGANPETVAQTQAYIDSYNENFIHQGAGSISGLQVGHTRQLIENIRHARTNQLVEPVEEKKHLIEV